MHLWGLLYIFRKYRATWRANRLQEKCAAAPEMMSEYMKPKAKTATRTCYRCSKKKVVQEDSNFITTAMQAKLVKRVHICYANYKAKKLSSHSLLM